MFSIIIKNNKPTISSLQIAENLGVEHKATLQLIDKYVNELKLFGLLTFEMLPRLKGQHGGGDKRICYLNRNQAIFLSTLSKNTENVVKFKALLTKAFDEAEKPKELTTIDILELVTNELKKLKAELDYKNQIVIEHIEKVPPQTMRITINRIVREYASANNLLFSSVWNKLYQEFKYLYHIDLKVRAKNQTPIELAEEKGILEDLYNLSLKIFELNKIN